jgi:GrpB-like predicted nucleotidyltransferase (UPF0157 family)
MTNTQPKPVYIVEYDPQWPVTFDQLKQVLAEKLGDLALGIEHVGSTAVPGLAAKPIIDQVVIIRSREQLPAVIDRLAELGYDHRGDLGIAGREAFGRREEDVPWDGTGRAWPVQHLYVCAQDNRELHRELCFRDHLRAHPEVAAEYAALKRALARRFRHDRAAYTEGKTSFVERILETI